MMKNEIWTRNALRDKISACFELIVYTYISKDIYGHTQKVKSVCDAMGLMLGYSMVMMFRVGQYHFKLQTNYYKYCW